MQTWHAESGLQKGLIACLCARAIGWMLHIVADVTLEDVHTVLVSLTIGGD